MTTKKSILISSIALFLALMAYFLASDHSQQAKANLPTALSPYAAVAKGRVDIEGGVIRLAAQREGLIQDVLVEEGAMVRKNQILATLDSRQAEIGVGLAKAELERAEAQVGLFETRSVFAQRDAKRYSTVVKKGAISEQTADTKQTEAKALKAELRAAQSAVAVALAKLKQAEFEVEVRQIRAPFDGRIIKRNAKPGDGISTLNVTELFQLAPVAPRIVRADVDEQFIDQVTVGLCAEIISETQSGQQTAGKIIRIGEVFGSRKQSDDPNERQDVRVVDTVLSLNDNTLRIGQRVLVKILADKQSGHCLDNKPQRTG